MKYRNEIWPGYLKKDIKHQSHLKNIHFWRMFLKGKTLYENTIIKNLIYFPSPLIISENLKNKSVPENLEKGNLFVKDLKIYMSLKNVHAPSHDIKWLMPS